MIDDLNSVNFATSARGYHHGTLRQALIGAAEQIIVERGLEGFSLREAARRAGVSPAAPRHHFADARGLLTALAAQSFAAFADALAAAIEGVEDRTLALRAMGKAYVRFAIAHPARFDLMWRKALIDDGDPDYEAAARRAFALLDGVARGGAADQPVAGAELAPSIAAWSMVHGFARLALDGALGTGPGAASAAADALLDGVLDRLAV